MAQKYCDSFTDSRWSIPYFIFEMEKCVSHVCYQLCTKVNLNTLCYTCVYQSQREGFKISV